MTQPVFEITKAATFDAAHYFADGPEHRPYANLHGHSFKVEATVRGVQQEPVGWVADLADLDAELKAVAAQLDHGLLNEKPGLERPTLEHLCLYFAERLKVRFPGLSKIVVSRPTISESCALNIV
ncbi:MAG: 6-carboxytetrahydropterin synthase [Pseudomonadota bacterium]|uniref:6-pyruvoyl trahydropterin synthase family protein n=1 Tax=unclassified Phenylobacterium TaxID=2640670 RepID=UPI0006F1FEC1|nr:MULTISPECIES: 6-carboxytetrahydropterin synthase [unclassified Phenylobacterium]KRB52220.1 6-pyruvoyl tetrahydrobiopterin synthase [Phenylobacterium sp. Root700]MBT9473384.1 6-pyruvoyl tetrahydropterin synthase family protein [Phenylobacterium sp.]